MALPLSLSEIAFLFFRKLRSISPGNSDKGLQNAVEAYSQAVRVTQQGNDVKK